MRIKLHFFLIAFFFSCLAGKGYGQQSSNNSSYITCSDFKILYSLKELGTQRPIFSSEAEATDRQTATGHQASSTSFNSSARPDTRVQKEEGLKPLSAPLVNFDGGSFTDRLDPTGCVGPNHFVQLVNLCNLNIFDKSGNLLLNTSIANLGGGICYGDPVVLYDRFADRWLLSDVGPGVYTVALSATSDPTGSYYLYTFPFPETPDYPKYSVWPDGYYITSRTLTADSVRILVLERDKMLQGNPNAGAIVVTYPDIMNVNNQMPGCPKILNCDGVLPVYGKPDYLLYFTNVNSGDTADRIVIDKLVTDTAAHTCTIFRDTLLPVSPFNAFFGTGSLSEHIVQPSATRLWSLDGTFQYRVPYLRFAGYNSVVLSTTVNLGDSVAGIRWYELRQNDTTEKWSVFQEGTYGPDDSTSRWNGSISMNANGDISLCYNVTNADSLYPGIRYTGRLAGDSLNQMTFAEATAAVGNFPCPIPWWGDYSQTTLDDDGVTFWHTNQYLNSSSLISSKIFSFRLLPGGTGVSDPASQVDVHLFQSPGHLKISISNLPGTEPVLLNLFDAEGKLLYERWMAHSGLHAETELNVSGLSSGTHFIRVSSSKFQKVVEVFW